MSSEDKPSGKPSEPEIPPSPTGSVQEARPAMASERSRRLIRVEPLEQSYTGPIPPPAMLEHYNRVLPGSADRIFRMAESQQQHRQLLETAVIQSKIVSEKQGQWFGFIIGIVGIFGAVYLVATGKSLAGFGVFLGSLGSLVAAFFASQGAQAKQLRERREQIDAQRERSARAVAVSAKNKSR